VINAVIAELHDTLTAHENTMAFDAFLKIDGAPGESQDEKHVDWMQLESYSFGATNTGTAALGTGMGHGKVSMGDFNFTPKGDSSVPILFLKTCAGDHIPKAILELQKTGGSNLVYLKVTFEELVLSSCQMSGHAGADVPNSGISFNFSKIKIESTAQTASGGAGKTVTAGWDVKKNVKL
jgi:type VI secretion system secreted protein Hcp